MIGAYVCCWLIPCKTQVQPNRTRGGDVPALDLSDFGDGHDAFACMGVGCESDDRKGFVGEGCETITTTFILKSTTGDIVISLLQGFM